MVLQLNLSTKRTTMLNFTKSIDLLVHLGRKNRLIVLLASSILLCLQSIPAWAENQVSLLITSNLQGKFSLSIDNQQSADPLLVLAQNILSEQQDSGVDFYVDLGNALYPGVLSKFSSGSIMVDFLDYFSCAAVLVSSKDLQVGTRNLELMQKNSKVRFLSANILQDGKPVFTSWFAAEHAGTRIAFLGLTSNKVRFDVAEKDLYGYSLAEQAEALSAQLAEIRAAGISNIILLSGLNLKDTAEVLEKYPDIGLALCGGDYAGRFLAGKASRVDLSDGRSILIANEKNDYYRLKLVFEDGLQVRSFQPRKASPVVTKNFIYRQFVNRLTLWKEKFREDEDLPVARLTDTEHTADDLRFGQLLRDRFDCDLGVVEKNTINQLPAKADLRHSDFLGMVNRDYNIFLISLTGDEINRLPWQEEDLVIAGRTTIESTTLIQGLPLEGTRSYRLAASQPAVQKIQRLLGRKIAYTNTWVTVSDLLMDDLKSNKVVLLQDYDYLDRRFRTTIDVSLANFVDNSNVKRGPNIETPPGQPAESYNKWGLENSVDIAVFNKYHRFVLTPYMFYSRQDENYLNNILRGTFLYDYNLSEHFKPYNKFRYDTVIEKDDGLRPSLMRETVGVSSVYGFYSSKLGIGFEKQVEDPTEAALYGVELILGANIPFFSHFTYNFGLDAFVGILDENDGQWQIRSQIDNGISASINSYLSLSFRHKYFYFNDEVTGESYHNSQFITSLDFKSDWKFW